MKIALIAGSGNFPIYLAKENPERLNARGRWISYVLMVFRRLTRSRATQDIILAL